MKTTKLVTKESLKLLIETHPSGSEYVIGNALVRIFKLQSESERNGNLTKFLNGVGFTAAHGRIGSISAKYFIKHGKLTPSLLKIWLKIDSTGFPRICKYVRQLNEIAHVKLEYQNHLHSNEIL